VRKLATAAAVSLVLSSGGARALGLGDIEMRSALNQPMNAEIRLTSVQPGEASGMIVKLASPDAFTRAGIERTGALTDLRFSVDETAGAPVIKISSSRPVVEPFLNFLVEVDWPTGRMVREYTVLLDPPVFMTPNASERSTTSEQPVTLQRNDESLITPTPIDRTSSSDGFEVEVVGSGVEVADNAEIINDAGSAISAELGTELSTESGEVVSLETLDSEGALAAEVTLDSEVALGTEVGSEVGSDGIGEVELLGDSAETITDQGDVVVLTDLGVANTDAAAQFQANQNFEFEVEVVGTSEEVSDTFVAAGRGEQTVSGSEIVSLDSLDTGATGTDVSGGEVTVQRGDTLSSIADQVAVQGISSQQMMMALLNANKNAFINGNVNLVKAGAILRIPEGEELSQLTQSQAVAQLGEQNQLWREYRDNLQSSAGTRLATTAPTPESDTEVADEPVRTELSDAAQRILDAAKNEAANRPEKELNIVAQDDSTTTAASATADNSDASETALLGEINKKLTLAKEELASTRLESGDLSEQSTELQSTAENMESLVNIRQSEVARLEEALRTATADAEAEKVAAAEAAERAAQAEADKVAQAEADKLAQAEADKAAEAEAELAAQAEAEKLAEAEQAATTTDTDAEGVATEAEPENALTAEGETLDSVELVEDAEPVDTAAESETATGETGPWYAGLLQKYGKWIVAGIGGLCALLLGMLLLGKRRKTADDRLEYGDEVEFMDGEDDGVQLHSDMHRDMETDVAPSDVDTVMHSRTSGAGASAAAAVGATAAAAGGAAAMASQPKPVSNEVETSSLGAHMDGLDNTHGPDGLDPDDTISEVDVYLAYGLHGQAEELLGKAIDRDPTNHEYAFKLLQTQHAQGNAEAFAQGATRYHDSFGGDKAPNWNTVCNLGHDLQPNNELFSGSAAEVASIGKSDDGSQTLDADDFTTDENSAVDSVSRDFGDASETAGDVDESDLMDQSLDPAFAFDMAAEEASANAGAKTEDKSLDISDFNASDTVGDVADAGKDKLSSVGSSLKAGVGGAAAAAAAGGAGLAAAATSAKDGASDVFDDSLSLDDIDSAASAANDGAQGSVAEDLTLDLDQLSGDLDLDSSDVHDQTSAGALEDLEIADLTGNNELLGDNVSNIDGSDEMETMMDLAKAYIDMGDKDSASSALGEIMKGGNPAQVSEAETLLRKIS